MSIEQAARELLQDIEQHPGIFDDSTESVCNLRDALAASAGVEKARLEYEAVMARRVPEPSVHSDATQKEWQAHYDWLSEWDKAFRKVYQTALQK